MSKESDNVLPKVVEAALLDTLDPVDPGVDAAARMRAKLFDKVRNESTADELLTVPAQAGEWIETGPGNSVKVLRSDDETMSILVRLAPGSTFPRHYHPEDEETYVVEGETWFGDIHLVAGDYHLAPKGTTHGEVRTDTGCVLLIRKASE